MNIEASIESVDSNSTSDSPNSNKTIQGKPKMQNFYNRLLSACLRFMKPSKCLTKEKEYLFGDEKSIERDLFERGHTIENKCFKRTSCITKTVPLSYESIKRSILVEMKKCGGRLRLLYDIANGKITKGNLKYEIEGASKKEVDIALLWSAFCKKLDLMEELVSLEANVRYV